MRKQITSPEFDAIGNPTNATKANMNKMIKFLYPDCKFHICDCGDGQARNWALMMNRKKLKKKGTFKEEIVWTLQPGNQYKWRTLEEAVAQGFKEELFHKEFRMSDYEALSFRYNERIQASEDARRNLKGSDPMGLGALRRAYGIK